MRLFIYLDVIRIKILFIDVVKIVVGLILNLGFFYFIYLYTNMKIISINHYQILEDRKKQAQLLLLLHILLFLKISQEPFHDLLSFNSRLSACHSASFEYYCKNIVVFLQKPFSHKILNHYTNTIINKHGVVNSRFI